MYQKLGKSNLNVSKLSFGCMRYTEDQNETTKLIKHAYEKGINYFDTAPFYVKSKSEELLGNAIRDIKRDEIYLSSKYHPSTDDSNVLDKSLNTSLNRLQTDYLDIFFFWSLNKSVYDSYVCNLKDHANELKKSGKIRNIGFSIHDSKENTFEIVKDSIEFIDVLLLQFNLIDDVNIDILKFAKDHGVGTLIMGPLGGGRLAHRSSFIEKEFGNQYNLSEIALSYVLNAEFVDCALSGMESIENIDINLKTLKNLKNFDFNRLIDIKNSLLLEKLSKIKCTYCKYCMPCPQKINIPAVLEQLYYKRDFGFEDYANKNYKNIGNKKDHFAPKGKNASVCTKCGICLSKCPQNIDIVSEMKEANRYFKF